MFGGYEIPLAAVVVGRQSEICSGGVLQIRHGAAKLDKGVGVDLPIGVRAMDMALDTNLSYNGTSSAELLHEKGSRGLGCRYRRSRLVVENGDIGIRRTGVDNSPHFAGLF